jgi:hypothetical protein
MGGGSSLAALMNELPLISLYLNVPEDGCLEPKHVREYIFDNTV